MLENTFDCKIPSELVPKCPVCDGDMDVNLRYNRYFVQDEKWYELNKLYNDFLQECEGKKIIYMELGVGFNTPGVIRYPFEQMTHNNKNATLIRLNKEYPEGIKGNEDRTIAFTEDIQEVLSVLMNYRRNAKDLNCGKEC